VSVCLLGVLLQLVFVLHERMYMPACLTAR
jgi:hypothetical protein